MSAPQEEVHVFANASRNCIFRFHGEMRTVELNVEMCRSKFVVKEANHADCHSSSWHNFLESSTNACDRRTSVAVGVWLCASRFSANSIEHLQELFCHRGLCRRRMGEGIIGRKPGDWNNQYSRLCSGSSSGYHSLSAFARSCWRRYSCSLPVLADRRINQCGIGHRAAGVFQWLPHYWIVPTFACSQCSYIL